MKNLYFFLAFLFSTSPLFAQQTVNWTPLNLNTPSGWNIHSIEVVNKDLIWGVLWKPPFGDHVFRTTDGGQNFDLFQIPFTASDAIAFDINALDANTAFIASTTLGGDQVEGIYRTTDGGQNWELIFENEGEDRITTSIHFFDANNGIVFGARFGAVTTDITAIFHYTNDGGDSWTASESEFEISSIWSEGGNAGITAIGDTAWVASVDERIYRSIDKGITWTSHLVEADRLINDVAFKNSQEGIAISSYGDGDNKPNVIYHTSNGGTNWTAQGIASIVDANNISYIPGTDGGYIITSGVSLASNFLFTKNNGANWTIGMSSYAINVAEFLSPTLGYAGTRTSSGGLLLFNDDIFGMSTSIDVPTIVDTKLLLFPNPSTNQIALQTDEEWEGQLQIVNALGQIVYAKQWSSIDQNRQSIDTTPLPNGLYHVLLTNGSERLQQSFLKL